MLYLNFLDMKKKTKFGGVVRFCTVTSTMKFGIWDTHASKASVRMTPEGVRSQYLISMHSPELGKKRLATLLSTSLFLKPSKPIGHLLSSSQMCGFGS